MGASTDQRFKCRIRSVNLFGLYHNDDIARLLLPTAPADQTLEPFVAVDAVVVELMDLTTDKSHRHLTVRPAPAPASKLALEVDELF